MTDIAWSRFTSGKGELYAAFDSHRLHVLKFEDDKAFLRFQKNPDDPAALFALLPQSARTDLERSLVSPKMVGEFFCNIKIGAGVTIADDVNIMAHGGVTIADGGRIETGVQLVTIGHGLHPSQRILCRVAPIIIERGAVIQKGALIVNASTDGAPLVIGAGATVLAGSVVTSSVAAGQTVCGRFNKALKPAAEGGPLIPHFCVPAALGVSGCKKLVRVEETVQLSKTLRTLLPIYVRNPENIIIGEDCFINRGSILRADGALRIGDRARIAPGVNIIVEKGGALEIAADVWIGAGAEIIVKSGEKISVGKGSIIAAAAVVKKSVPEITVVACEDRLIRKITDADLESVPERWNDDKYVAEKLAASRTWNREQRLKAGF